MSGRRLRGLILLAALGGIVYWIHETRPTVSSVVDDLTRPLLGNRAAVKGSEHKRVVREASQVLTLDEEKPVGAIHEGMTDTEVRRLLGEPDDVQSIEAEGPTRVRWLYRSVDRVVVFERRRVVSIAVR